MIRRPPRSTPLSLHDALPISLQIVGLLAELAVEAVLRRAAHRSGRRVSDPVRSPVLRIQRDARSGEQPGEERDRKSTRLNSSHTVISYAVFCLKKKKKIEIYG